MPIIVCPSGHKLRVQDQLAGKKVRCPRCQKIVVVTGGNPAGTAVRKPPAPSSSRACPSCQQPVSEDAVLCVNCGTDLRTGKPFTPPKEKVELKRLISKTNLPKLPKFMVVGAILGALLFFAISLLEAMFPGNGYGVVPKKLAPDFLINAGLHIIAGAVFGALVIGMAGLFASKVAGFLTGAVLLAIEKTIALLILAESAGPNSNLLVFGAAVGFAYGLAMSWMLTSWFEDFLEFE